jgi:hypothetical protein
VNNTDFKSHWLCLVKPKYGPYTLLVKHGAGEERIPLVYIHVATGLLALSTLDADQRYLVLYTILRAHTDAQREATQATANKYQVAFLEGRLKRRRRNHRYHVEIKPSTTKETP